MYKVRIRRGILVTLVAVVLFASVTTWVTSAWVARSTARELTTLGMQQTRDRVALRIAGDLAPAMSVARLNADLLEREVFDLSDDDFQWLMLSYEVQLQRRSLYGIYVAQPDGSFWDVRVNPAAESGVSWKRLPALTERTPEWEQQHPEWSEYFEYDPRGRNWYRDATDNGAWTNVYQFRSGPMGITASTVVRDEAGEVRAVVGVDLAVDELAAFVREIHPSENGRAALIGAGDTIIAHRDPSLQLVATADPKVASVDGTLAALLAPARETSSTGVISLYPTEGGEALGTLHPLRPADDPAAASNLPEMYVAVIVPAGDFLGPIEDFRGTALVICITAVGLALLVSLWVTRGIARPIQAIEKEMEKVQNFDLTDVRTDIPSTYIEVDNIVAAFARMVGGLQSFSRYVPSEVVRDLLSTDREAKIGGEERDLSIMFADIEGFTRISEKLPPREVFERLAEYFSACAAIIRSYGGTLDKYIGDAVMAFWNAPREQAAHPQQAVLAAIDIQQALSEINGRHIRDGKEPFITRIALGRDEVMVGNVGASDRLNYTALGDGVNLAARLEGANKVYGTHILVSEKVAEGCDAAVVLLQRVDVIAVKGREAGVRIFEVLGRPNEVPDARKKAAAAYEAAHDAFLNRDFATAESGFAEVLSLLPGYRPAELLLERTKACQADPPGADWNGCHTLTSK